MMKNGSTLKIMNLFPPVSRPEGRKQTIDVQDGGTLKMPSHSRSSEESIEGNSREGKRVRSSIARRLPDNSPFV
jgi:hypothetical protein